MLLKPMELLFVMNRHNVDVVFVLSNPQVHQQASNVQTCWHWNPALTNQTQAKAEVAPVADVVELVYI